MIVAVIALLVCAAAVAVLFPALRRRWTLWRVGRLADFPVVEKPVLAGRGGASAGPDGELPIFGTVGHGGASRAASPRLIERLEEQILANLSRAMPINLYYVADDADCAILAERLWQFLGENGFTRGEYSGGLKPGSVTGLRVTMKAESCDMLIAPPR